jgi:hypothetical protein
VRQVSKLVANAAEKAKDTLIHRESLVRETQAEAEKLVEEYFDIDPVERMLIEDTNRVIIPSVRPTRKRVDVPTIKPSTDEQRERYSRLLCDTLNGFAQGGKFEVHARAQASLDLGVGLVVLEKTPRGEQPCRLAVADDDLLRTLRRLEGVAAKSRGSIQLVRGAKVLHENLLYVIKPIGQRFWTSTAALNDADEIAATILMRSTQERA